ncbi:amidase [Plantibacter sp. YIM 135249]|uniref:amidase n=1 Tax=Plantibacter sp. YIM 135249 TaxID=3423918 RepID=UPI003D3542E5
MNGRSRGALSFAAAVGITTVLCAVPAASAFGATMHAEPGTTAASAASPASTASDSTHPNVVGLGITEAAQLLTARKTTSEALVTAYLQRIAAYDRPANGEGGLDSIITVDDEALAEAKRLDAERAAGAIRGPLHGVPIVVKDNIATAGMPTTAGNGAMRDYRPEADATSIQRLRDAGAIIIAKTNLAEFALTGDSSISVFGEVKNPFGATLGSSGSSGGSAAATAVDFAAGGIGTDTAGSIIGPSANGALVGVRPTFGLTSLDGVVPGNTALDTLGPMTKSVRDAAVLLDVLAGSDEDDPRTAPTKDVDTGTYVSGLSATSLQGARIGVPADWDAYLAGPGAIFAYLDVEGKATYDRAITELQARGAVIVPVAYDATTLTTPGVPSDFGYQVQQFLKTTKASVPPAAAAIAEPKDVFDLHDVLASPDTTLAEVFAEIQPSDTPDPEVVAALETVPQARQEFADFFTANGIDAFVLPSTASAAPLSLDGSTELTSRAGAPGVTVPSGIDAAGRPLGIKFIGQRYDDGRMLSFAYDYEQATHHRVAPSGFPELTATGEVPTGPVSPAKPTLPETGVDIVPIAVLAAAGLVTAGAAAVVVMRFRRARRP